jgi:hypothetical protein
MDDPGSKARTARSVLRNGACCHAAGGGHGVWGRSLVLTCSGGAALWLGLLVYLVDRSPSHALLIPDLGVSGGPLVFGALGQWLPSAMHALAFSLFTAAVLKPGCATRVGACTFWGLVNAAFELGQHPAFSARWAAELQGGAGDGLITRSILNYLLRGTFDPGDLCAALLGALAAGALLHFVDHDRGPYHASC